MKDDPDDMISPLVTLNKYTARENGVFTCRDTETEGLSYSDGDIEEEYIYSAVASADDLSSWSEELRSFERDWASECHLSSKRANVFRALDFTGVRRVIEIGSGCGAITRFLGEQGMAVDAVEGSFRRAEITRLRCRGLDNITVIQADFNDLQLLEGHYDLALLTGVLEYAGKFSKAGEDPVDAAVSMLDRIISCLRPGGALVVAIENRIGFKYLAGASEDHFSRPWVGLSNYPDGDDPDYREKQGIRTWDRSQWQGILERLPGITSEWYYPFPDYKLATTLLSENFIRSSSFSWSCLSRVNSRDYTAIWHPAIDEQLFWQTAAAARAVEEMANSFVLVLQRERSASASNLELVPFDFVHFSGHNRKPEYRVIIQKKKDENRVTKTRNVQQPEPDRDAVVVQHLEEEPFYEGKLLAVYWCDVLRSCPSPLTFDKLLQEYFEYVVKKCKSGKAGMFLDLLPFNIMVAEDESWQSFDQEWQTELEISPQYIFFRAVFYFYLENKEVLQAFCKRLTLRNGWDYVKYCLDRVLSSGEYDLPKFVALENMILQGVSRHETLSSVESILDSRPEREPVVWSWEKTFLVWGKDLVVSTPDFCSPVDQGQRIVFRLPTEVCYSDYIQLSLGIPGHHIGNFFTVRSFTLYGCRSDGSREKIVPVKEGQVMPPLMQLTGLLYLPDIEEGIFVVDDKEPQVLHFLFVEQGKSKEYTNVDCEVVLEVTHAADRHTLVGLVNEKHHKLEEIESSRAWQTVLRLRKVKEKIAALIGR